MASGTRRAGDLFNPGSISVPRSALVTAAVDHFYPARERDAARPHVLLAFKPVPDCSLTAETHDCYLGLCRSYFPSERCSMHRKRAFCTMGTSRERLLLSTRSQRSSGFRVLVFSFPRQLDKKKKKKPKGRPSIFPGPLLLQSVECPCPRGPNERAFCSPMSLSPPRRAILIGPGPVQSIQTSPACWKTATSTIDLFLSPFQGPQVLLGKLPILELRFLLSCPISQSTKQL